MYKARFKYGMHSNDGCHKQLAQLRDARGIGKQMGWPH